MPIPKCPRCNRPGKPAGEYFQCPKCGGFFDGRIDDDGGDYFADPSRRAEMADEKRKHLGSRRRR